MRTARFLDGLTPFDWPLAGADLALAVGRVGDHCEALFPGERAALTGMGATRAAAYSSGRRVAHAALSALGLDPVAVPRQGRLAVWPDGVVGCIAHSSDLAVALLGRASRFAAVGVDAERCQRVGERLARRVLTLSERQQLSRRDETTLRFSAKEAVYKAVYPLVGEYLGFQDVEVALGEAGRYTASTTRPCASASAVGIGEGICIGTYGHWLTAFVLPLAVP